jgi:hypothetical protein
MHLGPSPSNKPLTISLPVSASLSLPLSASLCLCLSRSLSLCLKRGTRTQPAAQLHRPLAHPTHVRTAVPRAACAVLHQRRSFGLINVIMYEHIRNLFAISMTGENDYCIGKMTGGSKSLYRSIALIRGIRPYAPHHTCKILRFHVKLRHSLVCPRVLTTCMPDH